MVVQRSCPRLLLNNFTRIALTPSAKALAPSSPISLYSRKSVVIDWQALSCLELRTPFLNLVSHGHAPRKMGCALQTQLSVYMTKCVGPAYRAHVFQHTMLRQLLAVDKVMKSARGPAEDTRSATCMSPATAEFRISKLMLFNTPHQTSSAVLQPGGCRRRGATFVP